MQLLKDRICGGCPLERLAVRVVRRDEMMDALDELFDAGERAAYPSGQVILNQGDDPRMLVSASLHRGHMDTSGIELPSRRTRRRHAPQFRDQVVQACRRPGVSIAAVALANGLNANMVRKWVIDAEAPSDKASTPVPGGPTPATDKPTPSAPPSFLPLALPAPAAAAPADEIRIELQRGATAIKVAWPSTAAADCAAWLRELLR